MSLLAKLQKSVLVVVVAAGLLFSASSLLGQPAYAASCPTVSDGSCKCSLPAGSSFLSFPHWWQYLNGSKNPSTGQCDPYVSWPSGVWAIGLAVLDMLLHVAGIAAVISIIVAAVMYTTSTGDPSRASAALNRIISSLVGLAIVLVAASVVAFIGNRIG